MAVYRPQKSMEAASLATQAGEAGDFELSQDGCFRTRLRTDPANMPMRPGVPESYVNMSFKPSEPIRRLTQVYCGYALVAESPAPIPATKEDCSIQPKLLERQRRYGSRLVEGSRMDCSTAIESDRSCIVLGTLQAGHHAVRVSADHGDLHGRATRWLVVRQP